MKKYKALALAFLLALSSYPAKAEETEILEENMEEIVFEAEETIVEEDETVPVSEEMEQPAEDEETGSSSQSEETVPEEEPAEEENLSEQTEEDPETEPVPEETETVSEQGETEETVRDDAEGEDTPAVVFELSEKDLLAKRQMAENHVLEELASRTEGLDYAANEIVLVTDSEEYAEKTALAYGGVLERYDGYTAVIQLPDGGMSVYEAVETGMDTQKSLPAVDANWLVYLEEPEVSPESNEKGSALQALHVPEKTDWAYWIETLEDPDPLLEQVSYSSLETYAWQWYHEAIGTYAAWGVTTGSEEVRTAVIDSGVQADHEELSGKVTIRQVSDITSPVSNNHGTHVAGIIAGTLGNGKGGAGIAPDVSVYSYNVFRGSSASSADIASAILMCAEDGIWTANMSFGTVSYSQAVQDAVNTAYEAGVTLIAAMGNYGSNVKCYPAAYDHVIAVGATDRNGVRAAYSDYGSWCDIAAPGSEIASSYYAAGSVSGYRTMEGTSMASPVVTGSAALYMSAYGHVSPDEMEAVLERSTDKADGEIGAGIISLKKLFGKKESAPLISFDEETNTVSITKQTDDERAMILYTLDGKNPAVKNKTVKAGNVYTEEIDLSGRESGSIVTVKAAVVSGMGVISDVSSLKVMIKAPALTVAKKKIEKITLVNTSLNLAYGVTSPESAVVGVKKILLEDGTAVSLDAYSPEEYQWYSSNENIVTVDQTGTVTSAGSGSAYVYLKIRFQNSVKSAKCKVTVKRRADSITVKGRSGIVSGKTLQMKASVKPSAAVNKKLSWSIGGVSDPAYRTYVSIDKNGLLKTKKGIPAGTVITVKSMAKDGSGVSGTYDVTVCHKAVSVKILHHEAKIKKASLFSADLPETMEIENVLPLDCVITTMVGESEVRPIWASSNPKAAKVDAEGNVTAIGKGTAVITCAAADGSGVKASVKVKVTVPTSGIFITVPSANRSIIENLDSMVIGKSCTLKAQAGKMFGKPTVSGVKWRIEEVIINGEGYTDAVKEKKLITVSSKGKVTVSSKLLSKVGIGSFSSGSIVVSASAKDGTEHYDEKRIYLREKVKTLDTKVVLSGGSEQDTGKSTIAVSQNKSITVYAYTDKRPQAVDVRSSKPEICGARVTAVSRTADGYRTEIKITGGMKASLAVITVKENGSGLSKKVNIRVKEAS